MTAQEAIQAIVTYQTLPAQIDYRLPWKIEAVKAMEFLDTLSDSAQHLAEIESKVDAYYAPTACGYSTVELNDIF